MKKSGKADPGGEKPGETTEKGLFHIRDSEGTGKRHALVMGHIFWRNPFLALCQTKI